MTAYPFKHRPGPPRPGSGSFDPTRPSKNISTPLLVSLAKELIGKSPEERARLIREGIEAGQKKELDEPKESE